MIAPRLFAIVLAAGRAERYGTVKQLEEFEGQALAARAARTAEKVCGERTVLVTGNAGSEVHAACAPLRGFLVHNNDFSTGMASSIRCAVAAVSEQADGILILLADQPLITPAQLKRLCELWQQNPQRAVASRYAGTIAVPAIFPKADFKALMTLDGDQGARSVLHAHGDELTATDMPEAALDIDCPEDLEHLRHRGS